MCYNTVPGGYDPGRGRLNRRTESEGKAMKEVRQIWTARFANGMEITKTGEEFTTRVAFYNWICANRFGKQYGQLIEITAKAY